jgi:hypothetical protein
MPARELSLCVFRPVEAAESFYDPPPSLRFPRGWYMQRGTSKGGSGWPHHLVAWPGVGPHLGVVWAPGGAPPPLLLTTSVFWQNRNFWIFSWNCWSSEIVSWQSFFQQNFDSCS